MTETNKKALQSKFLLDEFLGLVQAYIGAGEISVTGRTNFYYRENEPKIVVNWTNLLLKFKIKILHR